MSVLERTVTLTAPERIALKDVPFDLDHLRAGQKPSSGDKHPLRFLVILKGVLSTSRTPWAGVVSIAAFHVPGEMFGAGSSHLDRLSAMIWRAALVDGEIARECLVNVGQRPAINRMAHLRCETMARMEGWASPAGDAARWA